MALVTAWLGTLGLNGTLGLGAYWAARHGWRQPAGWPRVLGAVTLAWAWGTLGMQVLGSFGLLSLLPLWGWSFGGLAIGLACRFLDRSPARAEAPPAEAPANWEAVIALGLVLWTAMQLEVRSITLPVKVVSDGPIYHLYFAARWWKAARLFLVASPFGENAATYFPAIGDLWYAWLMIGWGGERLAKVGQGPFLLVAAQAAYALARRLGAGRSPALLATAWFVAVTPLVLFTFEPNVDTIFVAGYLLAAYFFLRYALGDDGLPALGLGGLAAGGALGTKAVGVVFVPALLLLAAGAVFFRRPPARHRVAALAILCGLPLVMSGYWYGRNVLLTGNPLYPMQVTAFGRAWLPGWYGSGAMRLSPYYVPVGDWRALIDTLLAVLDPRLAPVWVAALAGAWAWGKPGGPYRRWVWVCSALSLANFALYWGLIPYRSQQRFMFQALGLAVVPLALTFQRARRLRAAAVLLLAVHLLSAHGWPFAAEGRPVPWDLHPEVPNNPPGVLGWPSGRVEVWVPRLAMGLGAFLTAWVWTRGPRKIRAPAVTLGWAALSLTISGIALFQTLGWPRENDRQLLFYPIFADYLRGWLALEARSGPSGTTVAYSGTNLPYYLLGSGLRNEVRYINVDAHRDWLMHDYFREARARGLPPWTDPRPGWDRLHPDYDAWLANLRAARVRLLFVARANPLEGRHNIADPQRFPIERQWADTHPETFEPVHGAVENDPNVRLYRLRPVEQIRHPAPF